MFARLCARNTESGRKGLRSGTVLSSFVENHKVRRFSGADNVLPAMRLTILMLVVGLLFLPVFVQAAEEPAETPVREKVQNTPAVVAKHVTVVGIEHVGSDSPGTRLVFSLKELCNSSSLFSLVGDGKNRIQIVVHTAPEFPSRPEVGSVFSVAWLYQDKDGNLPYYLDQQTGVVTDQTAEMLARQLAERTDRLGRIYEYLFR